MSEPLMNFLQSFLSWMYPGSIRTDSIESIKNDSEHQYKVGNIDEQGNVLSRGEIHVTEHELLYFMPGRLPTRWPLKYLRRYGFSEQDNIFLFEAGRRCQTGEAIFSFRLDDAVHLFRLVMSINNRLMRDQVDGVRVGNQNEQGINVKTLVHRNSSRGLPESRTAARVKKDAATVTDNNVLDSAEMNKTTNTYDRTKEMDPRPLPYALIDFDSTKALSKTQNNAHRPR